MTSTERARESTASEIEALRARVAELERAEAHLRRAQQRMAVQHAVSQVVAEARSLDDATPRILQAVCAAMGWDWGALWVIDRQRAVLRLGQFWHAPQIDTPAFDDASRRLELHRGAGLPGRVWAGKAPVWVEDVTDDGNFPRAPYARREGLRAAVAFPVPVAGEVVGVIEFFSREIRRPDDELLAALGAVGSQIGQLVERSRAVAELRVSEARNRAILASAPDAIISIDAEGRITELNPAAESLFGYRRVDVLGRELADVFIPPSLRAPHRAALERFRATGEGRILGRRVELTGMRADGSEFPVELAITAVPDDGTTAFTGHLRDLSERRRQEEQARLLGEVGVAVATSLDYEQTLARVARLAVPTFADWCIVDLVVDEGAIQRLSAAHADPRLEDLLQEMIRRFPPGPEHPHPAVEVSRTGVPLVIHEVPESLWRAIAHDAEHLAMLQELQPRSGLTVPLVARGRSLGIIEFVRSRPGWRFDDADRAFGEELARRAAVAVDNARLYRAAREALRESHESLAQLETVLAGAPVGLAFWDRELRFVRINAFLAAANGLPVEAHIGRHVSDVRPRLAEIEPLLRSVLTTGEPVLNIEITGDWPDRPQAIRHWLASYYPVRGHDGEIIGVGGVVTDVTPLRAAEDRLRFIADASTVASGSLDYEETLQRVARLAVPFLGDWCVVYLRDDAGRIERLALEFGDPARAPVAGSIQQRFEIDPDAQEGVPLVIRTGQAVIYPEATPAQLAADVTNPDEMAALIAPLGIQSWMCVPLTVHGRTIGAMSFMSAEPGRRYGPDDLALAEEVGRRAAVAVENARLYRAAQEAIRAREQFLSIASHELKTPLTSIKASAQLLDRRFRADVWDHERIVRLGDQLRGEIGRLEHLVADLLDASRIQQGRLDLRPEPADLVEIARAAVARFEYAPERTGQHTLIVDADGPVEGVWDASRLDQVFTNLVSNALKYSPEGGEVRICVARQGATAVVTVSDRGIGIAAEQVERLFQPFARADVARQSFGGTGLGLFITAEIVERHQGAIEVTSEPGSGSTFTVRLPLALQPDSPPATTTRLTG